MGTGKKSRTIKTIDDNEQYSMMAAVKTTLKTVYKRMNEAGLLSNNAKLNTHILPEKTFEPTTLCVCYFRTRNLYAMKKEGISSFSRS
jgi:hypothetical protein